LFVGQRLPDDNHRPVAVSPGKPFFRQPAFWLGLILVAALAALAWRLPPDGRERAALAQFFGRFHPILVHLPIGLLILVPVLELAGAFGRRDDLRASAGFVLNLAAAAAVVAALDGWLLARSGGYYGPLVVRHMWCGAGLAALCLVAAAARSALAADRGAGLGFGFIYGPLLLGALGLLTWTSHQGGQLSHGEGFLSEYMPGRLRAWLHVPTPVPPKAAAAVPASQATFYGARIAPIFTRSCVSCHGPAKVKGDLRLDSYAGLMLGGKGGEEIEPWQPAQSELVRRLLLPPDDDERMPNNGKNPPTLDEIHLIEQWIAAGASDKQPLVIEPVAAGQ
jgi:mono/diheme cytochrome c family protein